MILPDWNRKPFNYGALLATIILVALSSLILSGSTRSQPSQEPNSTIQALQKRIEDLKGSLAVLERFRNNIICGRMDSGLLKDNIHNYSDGCSFISGLVLDFNGPKLRATLVRPGVFKFEFNTPLSKKPFVSTIASKTWGNIPVEAPILRVTDVSQSGFTVEAFESVEDANPTNVGFFFVVLLGEPLSQ